MADASSSELLDELNQKRKRLRILPFAVVALLLFLGLVSNSGAPVWVFALVACLSCGLCWHLGMRDAIRRTTVVLYHLEPRVEQAYQGVHDAFADLRSCSRTWLIEARGSVEDRKYHGGAAALLRRSPVRVTVGAPPRLKTNLEVPLMPVGRQTLAFMPDRLLVFDSAGIGAVSYSDLHISVTPTQFIEDEMLPPDAEVVGATWRYVNKNGGPDRRFKDNREIPICQYEQLHFTSASGLNEAILVSRTQIGSVLVSALLEMGRREEGATRV
jgi:hypothetical protein